MHRLTFTSGNAASIPSSYPQAVIDAVTAHLASDKTHTAEVVTLPDGGKITYFLPAGDSGAAVLFLTKHGKVYRGTDITSRKKTTVKDEDRKIVLDDRLDPDEGGFSVINGLGEEWRDPEDKGILGDVEAILKDGIDDAEV